MQKKSLIDLEKDLERVAREGEAQEKSRKTMSDRLEMPSEELIATEYHEHDPNATITQPPDEHTVDAPNPFTQGPSESQGDEEKSGINHENY